MLLYLNESAVRSALDFQFNVFFYMLLFAIIVLLIVISTRIGKTNKLLGEVARATQNSLAIQSDTSKPSGCKFVEGDLVVCKANEKQYRVVGYADGKVLAKNAANVEKFNVEELESFHVYYSPNYKK